MKVVNRAYKKVKIKPYDITARDVIGRSIEKEDVIRIDEVARDLLENQASYADRIEEEKHAYFYNVGTSGEAAADYIISRLVKKKKKKKTASAEEAPAAEAPAEENN